jgi:hypothetical protein
MQPGRINITQPHAGLSGAVAHLAAEGKRNENTHMKSNMLPCAGRPSRMRRNNKRNFKNAHFQGLTPFMII